MHIRGSRLFIPFLLTYLTAPLSGQSLRVAAFNMWTGLDYNGVLTIGEYESAERREQRFQMAVREFQSSRPDVIALQEANPVGTLTRRLASALDYDCVYQRVNSGLKFGPLGIPWNLNEGLAILARKDLGLQFEDVWELSEGFGVFGDVFSLHSHEKNIALVASVRFHNRMIILLNVHTTAAVPYDSGGAAAFSQILAKAGIRESEHSERFVEYAERACTIERQLDRLAECVNERFPGIPKILMGDLNVASSSPLIRRFLATSALVDLGNESDATLGNTWDPDRNSNIRFSRDSLDASLQPLSLFDWLSVWYDGQPRRIDYVLVDNTFAECDGPRARTIFDAPEDGVYASDHYGILADIPLTKLLRRTSSSPDSIRARESSEFEPFPILSYDTDVGLGYGAKAFYLNPVGRNESFDFTLFNSTKGERWYRFVYSVPDFEIRQGKVYPLALDFIVDYDKYLKNSFFGVGNQSRFDKREYYTREPLELSVVFSRGFTTRVVAQFGVKYDLVTNFPSDTSRLRSIPPSLNTSTVRYHSLFVTYRYDSRNSFINPSRGFVLQGQAEYAPQSSLTNVSLEKVGVWAQYYATLFYPKTVLALRLGMQGLIGDDLPVQVLLPIGGNQTVRGSPQDRYLDKNSAVVNAEIRFPLYWRLGGVIGYDAGKVWHRPTQLDLVRWTTNPVVGLRFFMDTFVVRADLGFGKETTGFYLNFGHLF